MRILYHHRTQGEEPESIHISAIVDALTALGHEVRVVGPAPVQHRAISAGGVSLLGKIKRATPRLAFELMQLAYNLVAHWRLVRAIREFQPDVIYERYALFSFAGVRLARRRAIPLILEVNTPYAQAWAQYYGLYLKSLARRLEGKTLLDASHIVTVTNVQREMLAAAGIPKNNISVSHNAIDPEWFAPARHHGMAMRAALGLPSVVVGFVGTMNRWQGMNQFPEALRIVLDRCADVGFLFVGDGEFRQSLEDFCRAAGYSDRVVFTGRKPHAKIPPLVAAMDIAVLLNSNAYGSPMKIFEYMGMQKAVIAPAVGPVREIMQDGENGLLIEPANAKQMADCIIRLAQDKELRERLGRAGRAYVAAHHTWLQNALKIVEIYRTLAPSCSFNGEAHPC